MKIILSISFLLLLLVVNGQDARVLVRNAPESTIEKPVIQIKWYSSQFPYYQDGVQVYRRESGSVEWDRISPSPIGQKINFDTSAYPNDQDLGFFVESIKQSNAEEIQNSGFLLLNVLFKSFQSLPFSDFLGILYVDQNVVHGNSYEYRINRLVNGRETILSQSEPIRAEEYTPNQPVNDFSVIQQDTVFLLDWSVDPEAYYAFNIYQSDHKSESKEFVKINERPLVISEVTDSLGNEGYPKPKYRIDSLETGDEYSYFLTGLDFFGGETAPTDIIKIQLKDVIPPAPPLNLSGKADSMKVRLDWQVPEDQDIEEIRLYRSALSDGPFDVIQSFEFAETYVDSIKIPGPYYYFLSSVDSVDNEALSRKIFVEVQDVFPPSQPVGLTIASDTGQIILEWETNTEPDLEGYLIYRTVDRADPSSFVLLNSKPQKETRLLQELPKQVKNAFFYHIIAVDTSFNRSIPSEFVSIKMPDVVAPERPHIKRVTYDNDLIKIEWVPNVDRDLEGYLIYRLDSLNDSNKERVNVNIVAGDLNQFIDRSALENTEYYYEVVAIDSSRNYSEPSLPFYAFLQSEVPPLDKQLEARLTYNQKRKFAVIKWRPIDEDEYDLLGYVIYSATNGNVLSAKTGLLTSFSYSDKAPELEKSQIYQVRAYTKDGKVLKSEVLELKP